LQYRQTPTSSAHDRAAAILVIIFDRHIEDVIQLTWDDVTDDVVTIRLGKTEFALSSRRAHTAARRFPRP